MIEVSNQNRLSQRIQVYYLYSLGEMVLVISGVLLQLRLIRRLLDPGSIV
jgi:hypothetical protein